MKPTFDVALTCVGGRLTFDLINAIRRAPDFKVNITGMDLNANANGRFLCDQFFTIPNAETDQAHWFQSVLEIQHKTNFTSLIPLSEAEVKLTSSYNKAFAFNNVVTSVSDDLVVDIVNDKFHLMTTLQSEGIHVGPFHAINNEAELRQKITLLGYPDSKIVLKPRKGRGSRGVMILDANQNSFNALLPNRFCGHGCVETVIAAFRKNDISFEDCIIMPHYSGDVYDVDCVAKSGSAWSITARRRQLSNALWPTSTGHISSTNPIVIDYVKNITSALNINGAADFDVIVQNDGVPFVIDGACRFSGSVGVSFGAGVNMPAQLIRMMYGLERNNEVLEDGVAFRPFVTMASIQPAFKNELSDVKF